MKSAVRKQRGHTSAKSAAPTVRTHDTAGGQPRGNSTAAQRAGFSLGEADV
jgi:hypothetical protein